MAKVPHTIHGRIYWYDHVRKGKKVVCKYLGKDHPDMRKTTNASTRLANAPRTTNSADQTIYTSQEDLDTEVRNAYVRGGLGIMRIKNEIFRQIGADPTRREIENYLQNDLGVTLRTRKKAVTPQADTTKAELAQAKEIIAQSKINADSKDETIAKMKAVNMDRANEILLLKAKLRDYRDMGRAPTPDEIEALI